MVEHLGLARLSLGDQRLIKDVEDISANLLQLVLNLLAVGLDLRNMLIVVLGLLLLLDGRDNPPRRAASANNVLVGNGKEVALINGEFSSKL